MNDFDDVDEIDYLLNGPGESKPTEPTDSTASLKPKPTIRLSDYKAPPPEREFNLTPQECGLPSKFQSWRPPQMIALNDVMKPSPRFVAVPLPVGGGKSAVYMAPALLNGNRTIILTGSKGLQTQLLNDFGECGLVDVRGRSNFDCQHPGRDCEQGLHAKCRFRMTAECPYYAQYTEAVNANVVVTNYDYWAAINMHGKGLGPVHTLVCDEAHTAPEVVRRAAAVEIRQHEIHLLRQLGTGDSDWPTNPQNVTAWRNWAAVQLPIVIEELEHLKNMPEGALDETSAKRSSQITSLAAKLKRLSLISDHWASEPIETRVSNLSGWRIEPLRASDYAQQYLWGKTKRVILASATLIRKTLSILGVPPSETVYRDYPYSFDRANSKIIWVVTARVKANMPQSDYRRWLDRIDEIIKPRLDRKGIIHTVSYARAREIKSQSRYGDRMMLHGSGESESAVLRFKSDPAISILLSPALSTGYDFPGDECRYQIVVKLPFGDMRSPIQRRLEDYDPDHGLYLMAQELVQCFGRSVRSETDWAENFLIDDQAAWAVWKHTHLYPAWFPPLISKTYAVPQPKILTPRVELSTPVPRRIFPVRVPKPAVISPRAVYIPYEGEIIDDDVPF